MWKIDILIVSQIVKRRSYLQSTRKNEFNHVFSLQFRAQDALGPPQPCLVKYAKEQDRTTERDVHTLPKYMQYISWFEALDEWVKDLRLVCSEWPPFGRKLAEKSQVVCKLVETFIKFHQAILVPLERGRNKEPKNIKFGQIWWTDGDGRRFEVAACGITTNNWGSLAARWEAVC